MNIFVIEKNKDNQIDWVKSAKSLDNYRVVKMILESCQMLCTTINIQHGEQITPYKNVHVNHPSTKWVRESSANFLALVSHTLSMIEEYKERFQGRDHACEKVLRNVLMLYREDKFPSKIYSDPPLCMPDEFKSDDVVESYRKFYASKPRMRYPKSKIPKWFLNLRETDYITIEDNK
jgi:hypothetical protein